MTSRRKKTSSRSKSKRVSKSKLASKDTLTKLIESTPAPTSIGSESLLTRRKEEAHQFINDTLLGIDKGKYAFKQSDLGDRAILSKEASLARIRVLMPTVLEEDLKGNLESIEDTKWVQVGTNKKQFEALKQIVTWLDWPRDMTVDKKSLVWKLGLLFPSLPISQYRSVGDIEEKDIFSEGFIDRVTFTPSELNTTTVEFPFWTPSSHHQRTATLLSGVTFKKPKTQGGQQLIVTAPTFYECLVTAALVALVASSKLGRYDIQDGEPERYLLQGLGEKFLQNIFIQEITSLIKQYQNIGPRLQVVEKITAYEESDEVPQKRSKSQKEESTVRRKELLQTLRNAQPRTEEE